MTPGALVTFRLGDQECATALTGVREVVRLSGLADLPGMRPPLAGVLDLRGSALPVLDLRPGPPGAGGDVLVMAAADGEPGGSAAAQDRLVGAAVDQVRAIVPAGVLVRAGGADPDLLPAYVLEVLRGQRGVLFLVDLQRMVDAAREPVRA
jgi:purine-binding chemotaxis protein CheW